MSDKPAKSWKREMAVVIAIYIGVIGWRAASDAPYAANAQEVLRMIILPGIGFVFGAFGLHSLLTQGNLFKGMEK